MQLNVVPYTPQDNEAALALERISPQGGALAIRYRRATFHARSSVYEQAVIFCAKEGDRLVGIGAGALKHVSLHGRPVRALYGYDLRVHPEFRRYGTARRIAHAIIDELSPAECMYSFVAAQNESTVRFGRRVFGARSVIPLKFLVLPVFRRKRGESRCEQVPATMVREAMLGGATRYELAPEFAPDLLHGHLSSFIVRGGGAGCSLWTNESLLAEEVVRLPIPLRAFRGLSVPLYPLHLFPHIPRCGTTLKSLFVYDLFAHNRSDLKELLTAMNNFALSSGRTLIYILAQDNDPIIAMVRDAGFWFFPVPYLFLAKGTDVPSQEERLYIDIRDL